MSAGTAVQRGQPGGNKGRLCCKDLGDAPRASQGRDEGGKEHGWHWHPPSMVCFHLTFGRSQQTPLPSVQDSVCLFCLQDSRAGTKAEVKTAVSLCYLQQRGAFCLRDQSSAKALAGGLHLPGSVAGWLRGTDVTRANISRTRAASTQRGSGTNPTRPGTALSNEGDSSEGGRWSCSRMAGSRRAGAAQCRISDQPGADPTALAASQLKLRDLEKGSGLANCLPCAPFSRLLTKGRILSRALLPPSASKDHKSTLSEWHKQPSGPRAALLSPHQLSHVESSASKR